jgi:hypothetical protein
MHINDEIVRTCHACRTLYFFLGRMQHAISNVLRYGSVKQEDILHHYADIVAYAAGREIVERVAVQQDSAFGGLVKPHEQTCNRRFSGTSGSHQRHHAARLDDKRDVPEYFHIFHIAERDVLKFHTPLHATGIRCSGCFLDLRLFAQNFVNALDTRKRGLEILVHTAQRGDRSVQQCQIHQKGNQIFDCYPAGCGQDTACPSQAGREIVEQLDAGWYKRFLSRHSSLDVKSRALCWFAPEPMSAG